ncbi:hypothetical protein HPP92_000367 [Vanilla planifolia]|uniref:Uncharacterized protein n=1 Tax=Vanilla planifolia TaxID=51239 RepID=A0A835S4P8_VANPL|nr:hypothetical protein HPP92_000367 [Vanilla planifolia]
MSFDQWFVLICCALQALKPTFSNLSASLCSSRPLQPGHLLLRLRRLRNPLSHLMTHYLQCLVNSVPSVPTMLRQPISAWPFTSGQPDQIHFPPPTTPSAADLALLWLIPCMTSSSRRQRTGVTRPTPSHWRRGLKPLVTLLLPSSLQGWPRHRRLCLLNTRQLGSLLAPATYPSSLTAKCLPILPPPLDPKTGSAGQNQRLPLPTMYGGDEAISATLTKVTRRRRWLLQSCRKPLVFRRGGAGCLHQICAAERPINGRSLGQTPWWRQAGGASAWRSWT